VSVRSKNRQHLSTIYISSVSIHLQRLWWVQRAMLMSIWPLWGDSPRLRWLYTVCPTMSNANPATCRVTGHYASAPKKYYLTAAPHCAFPDSYLGGVLSKNGNLFDYISVRVSQTGSSESLTTK
jgi:hypothetical protein